jgi:hypothetical protein
MSSPVQDAVEGAGDAAKAAHGSRAVEALARLGLASRGLVWLVLGLLAVAVVRGDEAQTDQTGALRALAETPVGTPLLLALALGFAGYAAWLLLSAAVGHRDEDGRKRLRARLESGGKGVVYIALCVSTLQFLARGAGGADARSRTAEVMSHPGGRTAVGLVGAALLAVGAYLALKGLRRKHSECLEHYRVPGVLRRPAVLVGAVGYVGRGAVVALVGAFLVRAAVLVRPEEAKGLDAALQTVAQQPYGRVLLALAAVGVLAYALWSFFEAAYRDI